MNISERTNEFSKGSNGLLTVKSKVFSWIKLLFIPSVVKRSSESGLVIKYNSNYVYYKDENVGELVIPHSMFKDIISDFNKSSRTYYGSLGNIDSHKATNSDSIS